MAGAAPRRQKHADNNREHIMKTTNQILALIAMAGAAALRANAGESLSADGKTLTLSAASGETLSYTAALPASVETIVKTGTGSYNLAPSSSSFTGTIEVQQGTFGVNETKISSTAKWAVADGASLLITSLGGGEWDWRPAGALEIGGMGVNNGGAYQLSTSTSARHYSFQGGTKLVSDALVAGFKWGLGNIDMGGHDLYVKPTSSGIFYMTEKLISNPGNIHVCAGTISFGASSSPNPSPVFSDEAKYIVLSNGTKMVVSSIPATRPITFGVKIPSGKATLDAGSKTGWDVYRSDSPITGPVEAAGSLTVTTTRAPSQNTPRSINLFGPVSVAGSFRHEGTANLTFHDAQPHVFGGDFTTQWSGTTTFTNTTSNSFGADVTIGGGRTEVVQSGPNARTELRGKVNVTTLSPSGTPAGGTLAFEDAGVVAALAAENVVGGTTNRPAPCLSVSGATVFDAAAANRLRVGKNSETHGVLAIGPGAVMTNVFYLGGSGSGAIHMTGGLLYAAFGSGDTGENPCGSIGSTYGFIGITNGTLETTGELRLGNWGGRGLLVQKGGTVRHANGPFMIARSGAKAVGSCYVAGGLFDMGDYNIRMLNQNNPEAGTEANFTLDGDAATARANEVNVRTSGATGGATAFVNLNNGGVLEAERVRRSNTADGTAFYLNFDGGVFRARTDGDALGATADRIPSRVTAYAGGAVIDTQTNDVTWLAPIVRPEGGGIASIDLPAGMADVPSVGPGTVRIASTGGGTGASAVMDYDMETRQPTRIVVTSPGCGYDAGTTTVTLEDSSLNTYEATFTVAANATTGGLTKLGSGTLTLQSANTYGGATRVEGGTLVFSNPNGYPGGDFEVAAAAVQAPLAAPLLQAPSLTFSAGKGVRLTEADTLDETNFGASRRIATSTTPLASLPSLTIVNSDGTVRADPGVWQLTLSDGGRTLRLGIQYATVLFVR